MSYGFYSALHLGALFALAMALGGLWGMGPPPAKKLKAFLLGLHGLALFFLFFAGFGLIAKLKIPFPWPLWIYLKLLIWLGLAGAPVFIRKSKLKRRVWIFLSALALICLALLIARLKPQF